MSTERIVKCSICGKPYRVYILCTLDQSTCPRCRREADKIKRSNYKRRVDYSFKYMTIAVSARNVILDTMRAGDEKHGNTWEKRTPRYYLTHAAIHIALEQKDDKSEPHLEHALTDLALAMELKLRERTGK